MVPSRVHPGKVYASQSPQTLKQLLMIGGTTGTFKLLSVLEMSWIDRQPEFTQIDIEVSFCELDYIRNLSKMLIVKPLALKKTN